MFAIATQIGHGVTRWTDGAAEAIVGILRWFVAARQIRLVEEDDGVFSVRGATDQPYRGQRVMIKAGHLVGLPSSFKFMKGSRVELVLRSSRFMFRPLQLSSRAADFLDGIVRAQIDRLTPWSPAEAVFGWAGGDAVNGRVSLTIAATARTAVTPLVQAVAERGAASVAISTVSDDGVTRITVFDQEARSAIGMRRVSRLLKVAMLACIAAAVLSFAADVLVGDYYLRAEQAETAQRISSRRSAIRAGGDAGSNRSVTTLLERRKHELPPTVIILEQLSRILPDHTYVTELRVEGNTVQMIGVTRDAPSLIGLIEQSHHFTRATFFAPTTRSPNDTGERFHIEAHIEAGGGPRT
jgi:general secretion pathway protein L